MACAIALASCAGLCEARKEAVYDCRELLGVLLEHNIADYDLVFAFVDRPLDITFVPYENCVLVST
ncbi:MAG: hypothetical protein LBD23_15815, partial [Oscillospiraceae bacterium]|nr:hypothetical protein [Oscillospiraceae bacterium]